MEGYWTNNSILFLIGLTFFPRISLLFCNISGNILFWIGWFFLPRIMTAVLATYFYSSTDPLLVILSWLFAIGGETAEKSYGYKIKNKRNKKIIDAEYEIIN